MRILKQLSNLPLILVLSIKIKALKVGVNAADIRLRVACAEGCEKCEAGGDCTSVESCPVTVFAQRLERLAEALATEIERMDKLRGGV